MLSIVDLPSTDHTQFGNGKHGIPTLLKTGPKSGANLASCYASASQNADGPHEGNSPQRILGPGPRTAPGPRGAKARRRRAQRRPRRRYLPRNAKRPAGGNIPLRASPGACRARARRDAAALRAHRKAPSASATPCPPAALRCSTLGEGGLNCRVRDGTG